MTDLTKPPEKTIEPTDVAPPVESATLEAKVAEAKPAEPTTRPEALPGGDNAALKAELAGKQYHPNVEADSRITRAQHLVPAYVEAEVDAEIAHHAAERDSVLKNDKVYETAKIEKQLKGDAGQGRVYTDLVGRYGGERIVAQLESQTADRVIKPDFVVMSATEEGKFSEIVDAKAWRLRARDTDGEPLKGDAYYRRLMEKPSPSELMNMGQLKQVVGDYTASPDIATDGKMVLYFPEDTIRYAPQVKNEIENWSGTEVAHGKKVEVRSMEAWEKDLWADVQSRQKQMRPN